MVHYTIFLCARSHLKPQISSRPGYPEGFRVAAFWACIFVILQVSSQALVHTLWRLLHRVALQARRAVEGLCLQGLAGAQKDTAFCAKRHSSNALFPCQLCWRVCALALDAWQHCPITKATVIPSTQQGSGCAALTSAQQGSGCAALTSAQQGWLRSSRRPICLIRINVSR